MLHKVEEVGGEKERSGSVRLGARTTRCSLLQMKGVSCDKYNAFTTIPVVTYYFKINVLYGRKNSV